MGLEGGADDYLIFLRHPDQVLTREQLLSHVWGYDYDPGSNIVDVYVGYLRRKLGKHRLETVRGMGYRMYASYTQMLWMGLRKKAAYLPGC